MEASKPKEQSASPGTGGITAGTRWQPAPCRDRTRGKRVPLPTAPCAAQNAAESAVVSSAAAQLPAQPGYSYLQYCVEPEPNPVNSCCESKPLDGILQCWTPPLCNVPHGRWHQPLPRGFQQILCGFYCLYRFLNPGSEKVFNAIPCSCVSLRGRRQLFNLGIERTSPPHCPHGLNQLPLQWVKNLALLRSGFVLHFEEQQDLNHWIYLQVQWKVKAGSSQGGKAKLKVWGISLRTGEGQRYSSGHFLGAVVLTRRCFSSDSEEEGK